MDAAYNNAYANSLWGWGYVGSYAMTNSDEYFAMGLQVPCINEYSIIYCPRLYYSTIRASSSRILFV